MAVNWIVGFQPVAAVSFAAFPTIASASCARIRAGSTSTPIGILALERSASSAERIERPSPEAIL